LFCKYSVGSASEEELHALFAISCL